MEVDEPTVISQKEFQSKFGGVSQSVDKNNDQHTSYA
jgi:hypothetical protein